MKPHEFWDSTYRELNIYAQANLCYVMDAFKQNITLEEAVTDKIIMADAMSNRRPKIISLKKTFKNLFPEKQQNSQSPEEIAKRMRSVMNVGK